MKLGTHAENMRDCKNKGRMAVGERHGMYKLPIDMVRKAVDEYKKAGGALEIAKKYGITRTYLYHLANGHKRRIG